jgi:hypothetical protein
VDGLSQQEVLGDVQSTLPPLQPATESINYSGHSCYSSKSKYTIQVTYIIHCVYICTGIDKVNGVHDVAVSVGVVQGCKTKLRKDVTCIEYSYGMLLHCQLR